MQECIKKLKERGCRIDLKKNGFTIGWITGFINIKNFKGWNYHDEAECISIDTDILCFKMWFPWKSIHITVY